MCLWSAAQMPTFLLGELENRLLCEIYASAMAPEKWRGVLMAIARHIGAEDSALIFYDARDQRQNFCADTAPGCFDGQKPGQADGLAQLFADCAEGSVISSEHMLSEAGKPYPVFLSKLLLGRLTQLPAGPNCDLIAAMSLKKSDGVGCALGFYGATVSDGLSEAALAFLRRLAPHLLRSLNLQEHVNLIQHNNYALLEALKHCGIAAFVVDAQRRVVFASVEAMQILSDYPVLKINELGLLEACDARAHKVFEQLLQRLTRAELDANDGDQRGNTVVFYHPKLKHPLRVNLVALPRLGGQNTLSCALLISCVDNTRVVHCDYLQRAFAITRVEAQVVQLFLTGYSVAEIAQARGTSLETARGHIKSIMKKTGTHSQAALVRLLVGLT
jgi:DNA-binding CsgD family transcriptional regulator